MDRRTGHGPRLAPLPPEHSPDLKGELDTFFKTLGFVPNSVLTMQRKPKLVRAFVAMQAAIWDPVGKVDRGLKRLIAHVASRAAGDVYSMAHTASGALHFGISAQKLAEVTDAAASPLFSPAERAALRVGSAAGAVPNAVTDEMFAELRKHWSEVQIVEIVGVISATGFVNRWNSTMATLVEDEPMEVGEIHLAKHGWSRDRHGR